jgi:putative DNA primase/helicase
LETNEFRKHRRDDQLTQLAGVSFNADARCPKWDDAISLIFDGDQELIRYVRQVLGYSIAGNSGEHILPIAFGSGCNGKSFVWNAIILLAADYGLVANDSLLLGDKNAHATEKASLYQKRIVAISEPEHGCRMREARVKELTGDFFVTARRMREDFWTFKRTHTFWLSTNHLPSVAGTDEGIWRRLKVIPFTVDLRNKVTPIPDYHRQLVETEGPGMLNWLLDGYRDYREHGFIEPDAVKQLGREYRGDQDHLARFVADCCLVSSEAIVGAKPFFNAYQEWGGQLSMTAFGGEMAKRFRKDKATLNGKRNVLAYLGIALLSDDM